MDKIVDILLTFTGPVPYFLIFGILLVCGLGLPIPEDITLFAAGLSAYYGVTNLWVIILVSYVGVMLGDSLIFGLGAVFGKKLTRRWFFHKLLPEERLSVVRSRFHRQGNRLIFAARFMPGLRAPIFFSAGTLHLPYRVFLFYDGAAALLSVPLIVGAVFYLGDEVDKVVRVTQGIEHSIFFVILAVILAMLGKWYITHRRLRREK
jgi:membrane protein DedA with SNARE-associated domain